MSLGSIMEKLYGSLILCLLFRYQKNIDSGLLYYLQSGQTQVNSNTVMQSVSLKILRLLSVHRPCVKGIVVRRSDLVGLIMRRNELANDILKASTTQQLPPMTRV